MQKKKKKIDAIFFSFSFFALSTVTAHHMYSTFASIPSKSKWRKLDFSLYKMWCKANVWGGKGVELCVTHCISQPSPGELSTDSEPHCIFRLVAPYLLRACTLCVCGNVYSMHLWGLYSVWLCQCLHAWTPQAYDSGSCFQWNAQAFSCWRRCSW